MCALRRGTGRVRGITMAKTTIGGGPVVVFQDVDVADEGVCALWRERREGT